MPAQKGVRFAAHSTLNVYTPESSSNRYLDSPSSRSSSSGPITPPSMYPGHLPPPHIAYPAHRYEPFQIRPMAPPSSLVPPNIHRLLAPDIGILYDLTLPPESATKRDRYRLSSRELSEPATLPAVPYLQIKSPYLQWRISVSGRAGFVTLGDVLDAIYISLRKNIVREDFKYLSDSAQQRVNAAYERRYRSLRDRRAYGMEKHSGVKRVDFLMERNKFRGLVMTSSPGLWQLEVT